MIPCQDQLSQESGLAPAEPQTFELVLNYRSHSGIVNCARSVIELITQYWPYSIDPLKPERALIDGMRPTFYSDKGDVCLLPSPSPKCLAPSNRSLLRNRSSAPMGGTRSSSVQSNVRMPLVIPVRYQLLPHRHPCA